MTSPTFTLVRHYRVRAALRRPSAAPRRRLPARLVGRGGRPGPAPSWSEDEARRGGGRVGRRGGPGPRRRGAAVVARSAGAGATSDRADRDGAPRRRSGSGERSGSAAATAMCGRRRRHVGDGAPGAGVIVLGIETATELVGVAVRDDDGPARPRAVAGRRRHAETLAPACSHVLAQAGRRAGATSGPSPSTSARASSPGLRVGVAMAKGLAQGLGIGVRRRSPASRSWRARRSRPAWPGAVVAGGRRPPGRGLRRPYATGRRGAIAAPARRWSRRRARRPEDLAAELAETAGRVRCWSPSATGPGATPRLLAGDAGLAIAGPVARRPAPGGRWSPWPPERLAAGEAPVPAGRGRARLPARARRAHQLGGALGAAGGRRGPGDPQRARRRPVGSRCAGGTCADVMVIERPVFPEPWSLDGLHLRARPAARAAPTGWRGSAGASSATSA